MTLIEERDRVRTERPNILFFLKGILLTMVCVGSAFGQAPNAQKDVAGSEPAKPALVGSPVVAPTKPSVDALPEVPPSKPPVVASPEVAPTKPSVAPSPDAAPTKPISVAPTDAAPAQPGTQPKDIGAPQKSTTEMTSEVVTVTTTTQPTGEPVKSVYSKPFRKLFAVVNTDFGSFRIALQPNQKPITVENFVRLAEGTKASKDLKSGRISLDPFYDGLTFHRAIRGTLIQTGCPYGDGRGGPGHTIKDESNDFDTVEEGSVLMARASGTAKDSGGSQFYIMLRPLPDLTDQDTIFGKVIEGLDVVRKISEVKVDRSDRPVTPVKIISIKIQKE